VVHFIPVKIAYPVDKLVDLYVDNILRLHGAPKSFHKAMGMTLDYSTTFYPQTDGLLRACVLTYGSDWERSLSFVEFSYNNSHQASLKMSLFEALCGRKCTTPLMWLEVKER
jgi:hypothetical protein